MAQRDLHTTAKRLREVAADMGAAHVSAVRAKDNGAPDFSERIQALLAQTESLFSDIENAAGPLPERSTRKRVGVEGECDHPDCMTLTCDRKRTNKPLHGRAGYGG